MLDIKFIRENSDLIKEAVRKKHLTVDIDRLLTVDETRRRLLTTIEEKRAAQNAASEKIATAETPEARAVMIAEMKEVKDALETEEASFKEVMHEWQLLMVAVPNIPDISVPEGEDDGGNVEVRAWPPRGDGQGGEIPHFSFSVKSHVDLMLALDMVDFDRGSKVAGFRGYFLKNEGLRLSMALWNFVLNTFQAKGDFTSMFVPSLLRKEPFIGTGYLPQGEEDLYKTQDESYLAGTAEVGVMSYFMDETLEAKDLPKKIIAFSPCFRREAGSHGKDTKGLMRVHEFYKLEQVILCEASHETSVEFHETLTRNAEELLQALKLPYRVVVNCGGDLGLGQVKKYDIETWVPSEEKYRETHSASYFHDFQTRRLNIRYRDQEGKLRYVHSLNNTAVATPRFLVALVENYQQEDGSVLIPEALRAFMGTDRIEPRR